MRIALLHYTTHPEFGGVENMLRDQAVLLLRRGHEVSVISGKGKDPIDGYEFIHVPIMGPNYPLNQEVKAVLDRGQADQKFNKYRAELVAALEPLFANHDIIIVHNVLTMHFNLPLTIAIHDLSRKHRIIAWTHDLTATNSDYSLPNPTKPPWSLMRTGNARIHYVATSEQRRDELESKLKPVPDVHVISNFVDYGRLFNLTVEMRESLDALALAERDFVFLLPARAYPRKNIELGIEICKTLKSQGRNVLMLVTGAHDPNSSQGYSTYMRTTLPSNLKRSVVFVSDFFSVKDETMRDLYAVADCLMYFSKQEGFGLPIIEAALHRMPIWCCGVPAFWAIEGEGAFQFNNIAQLPDAIAWLEGLPTFRAQRLVRHSFDVSRLYTGYYEPLLNAVMETTPDGS